MNNCFRSHFAARAVIVAGLLAGLLFSSGEGIHLFPFPPPEAAQNPDPKAKGGEKIGYQENAPRVEKNQEKFRSRHQGSNAIWAAASNPPSYLPHGRLLTSVGSTHTPDSLLFRSQLFAVNIRGRAPPIL
jgi:hypothetical protein